MNRKYFSASLLLILLLLVMPFSLGGCSKDSPKRAVKKELNLIKELDESTIKAFVSYEDMMSSHASNHPASPLSLRVVRTLSPATSPV